MIRRTYLLPPPSAVAGIFGAILGLSRERLAELSRDMLAGAELRSLNGRFTTLVRLFKFDRPASGLLTLIKKYYTASYRSEEERKDLMKQVGGLLTVKESEELYMPEYKFAIASNNESLLEEGMRRLKNFDFEYEVFGGNDYHFVESIGEPRPAKVYNSQEGYGYCPRKDFERIEVKETGYSLVIPVTFLANVRADYIQVYGAKIIAKRELSVVDDGESRIFVYEVSPFLVTQIQGN